MSKAKFKVGDKVRILDGSNIDRFTGGYYFYMQNYTGNIVTITKVKDCYGVNKYGYDVKENTFTWDERGLELVTERPTWKVAIIPDGDKTIGRLYDGHNLVKEVSTVKSPHDEYSMEEAIKVICERLTEKPEKKEEPPKLYNGKVVCVDTGENSDYTVGKIYQFVNGYVRMDDGEEMPFNPIHTFEEWARWSTAKWIEVVE